MEQPITEQPSHALHCEENVYFVVVLPKVANLNPGIHHKSHTCCGTFYQILGLDFSEILMS